jgi:hypothetical protein
MNRRQWVISAAGASLLAASRGWPAGPASHLPLRSQDLLTEIDGFVWERMARDHIPGVAASLPIWATS